MKKYLNWVVTIGFIAISGHFVTRYMPQFAYDLGILSGLICFFVQCYATRLRLIGISPEAYRHLGDPNFHEPVRAVRIMPQWSDFCPW